MMLPIILYKNILAQGNLSVDSTYPSSEFHIRNLIDYRSFTKWKSEPADATVNIDVDFSPQYVERAESTVPIELQSGEDFERMEAGGNYDFPDAIGIFNHNLGTVGATIKVQHWDVLAGEYITLLSLTPTDNSTILKNFTAIASEKYRIELSNLTGPAEIAIIYLGERVDFQFRPAAPVISASHRIEAMAEYSRAGHLLGTSTMFYPVEINHRYELLLRSWYNSNFKPFWKNHARLMLPFFYGWDIANRADDIYFCHIDTAMAEQESLTLLDYTDELNLILRAIEV